MGFTGSFRSVLQRKNHTEIMLLTPSDERQHMTRMSHHLTRFWSTDRSLTVLLVLLFINIFVLNSLSDLGILRTFFVRDLLFSLILITGVMAIAKSRSVTVLTVLFALAISGSLVSDTCAGSESSNLGCLPVACFLGDARSGGGSTSFSRRTYLRSTGLWGLSLFICYSG